MHDPQRKAPTPVLSAPVTPALSSPGNACSRPLSHLLRSPLWSRHVKGSRGRVVLPTASVACCGTRGGRAGGAGGAGGVGGTGEWASRGTTGSRQISKATASC